MQVVVPVQAFLVGPALQIVMGDGSTSTMALPANSQSRQPYCRKWYTQKQLADAIKEIEAFKEGHISGNIVAQTLTKSGLAVELSQHSEVGSRAVQDFFEEMRTAGAIDVAYPVALQFQGSVVPVSKSMHGVHVIKKLIQVFPQYAGSFIIDELWSRSDLVCNKFVCRVFNELLYNYADNPAVWCLMDSILYRNFLHVATGKFSHYLIEVMLEYGAAQQRSRHVLDLLKSTWSEVLRKVHGYYVLAKVLRFGESEDVGFLASRLMELNNDRVAMVIRYYRQLPQHNICREVASLMQLVLRKRHRKGL